MVKKLCRLLIAVHWLPMFGKPPQNGRILESRRWNNEQSTEVLDVLSQSDTPALATDIGGHIVFWNRAAERLLGRPTNQVLGRRCYDVLGGKDIFGNRFCHENCSIVSMTRKGEAVQGFESF